MRARHGVGHGVDSELGGLGSAPCLPIWQVVNAQLCARSTSSHLRRTPPCGYVQSKCVAHRPTESKNNKSKRQFDCFESTALRPGPSPPRPSARTAATPVHAFGIYPGRHSQFVMVAGLAPSRSGSGMAKISFGWRVEPINKRDERVLEAGRMGIFSITMS